jgi:hypothetical protein
VNAVGAGLGFGTVDNEVTILDVAGEVVARAAGSKEAVADAIWDAVVPLVAGAGSPVGTVVGTDRPDRATPLS